jgi:hypothetical protein
MGQCCAPPKAEVNQPPKAKFIPKADQLFTIQIWKKKTLGYLKLNSSGWATIDEKKGTIFILGESEEGWKMCGENKVKAGRKYIQVADSEAEDKAYFRFYLSGAGRMKGHKCGVFKSSDSASFFEVGDGKLVPTSWPNNLLNCKLEYDEEKNILVFGSPESEDFVSVVYKQVVYESGKFKKGERVLLHNLTSDKELNNMTGIVVDSEGADGKYVLRLDNDKKMMVLVSLDNMTLHKTT